MRRVIGLILCVLIVLSVFTGLSVLLADASGNDGIWDGSIASGFESGAGTTNNPYIIKYPEQLAYFSLQSRNGNTFEGKTIVLANDIYLNNTKGYTNWGTSAPKNKWLPIVNFKGNFIGNGNTIYGMYVDGGSGSAAFIKKCNKANITSLEIKDSYFKGSENVAVFCANAENSTIMDCKSNAVVVGKNNVGGIAGRIRFSHEFNEYTNNSGIVYSNFYGTVTATGDAAGGICGNAGNGAIVLCANYGTVKGYKNVGGIVGKSGASIAFCYNAGDISGNACVGGISGSVATSEYGTSDSDGNACTAISYCLNYGSVSGKEYVGSVAGLMNNKPENTYSCYYIKNIAKDGNGTSQNGIGTEKGKTFSDSNTGCIGLSATEMTDKQKMSNLDFTNIWAIEPATGFKYPQFIKNLPSSYGEKSAIWDGRVAKEISTGSGTESDPYVIKTASELAYIAESVNSGKTTFKGVYFVLGNDIKLNDTSKNNWTLNATVWTAIGIDTGKCFSGYFDGKGYSVSGIITALSKERNGLFGFISKSEIKNLIIKDSYIKGTNKVGAIAGVAIDSKIIGCENHALVVGQKYVAGICGSNGNEIIDCKNYGNIFAWSVAGGIVGNTEISVKNCENYGTVISAIEYAGGIAGYMEYMSGSISGCKNYGTVIGFAGNGIIGYSMYGTDEVVQNCENYGKEISHKVSVVPVGEMPTEEPDEPKEEPSEEISKEESKEVSEEESKEVSMEESKEVSKEESKNTSNTEKSEAEKSDTEKPEESVQNSNAEIGSTNVNESNGEDDNDNKVNIIIIVAIAVAGVAIIAAIIVLIRAKKK